MVQIRGCAGPFVAVHHSLRGWRPWTAAAALAAIQVLAGCAHSHSANETANAGATPAAASPARKGTTGPWTAIVDGKEVPAPDIAMGDPRIVAAILDEGLHRNRVMDHLKAICAIGPRLTGSQRALDAGWLIERTYKAWGLTNVHQEQWGTIATRFDRGPSYGKVVRRKETRENDQTKIEYVPVRDMELTTAAWSRGTTGPVRAPVIKAPQTEEQLAAVKDKIKGSWLLVEPNLFAETRGVRSPIGRFAEMQIEARKKVNAGTPWESLPVVERLAFLEPAGFINASGEDRVWTNRIGPMWRDLTPETVPPEINAVVRLSDYDYLNSRLADGDAVEVELNLDNQLTAGPAPTYNTIAEIRGSKYPEEFVIVCAHLDSWDGPGSQGTVDNGTGTAVVMEAARILRTVRARPDRTIRFVHWTGEEQGLLGSGAYVKARPDEMPRISAVLNDDGGTNYEGGLPAASVMVPMLAAATAPINNQFYSATDGKFMNVNIRDTKTHIETHRGSDHAVFNDAGVPGFFWDEEGRADYRRGWHTQYDRLDQAIPEYLEQSATTMAMTAYRLACAPTLLPRVGPPGHGQDKKPSDTPPTEAAPQVSAAEAMPARANAH